jgi:hypothetical protein
MRKSKDLLIHALAIHAGEPGTVCARGTIRIGKPTPGDHVHFECTDRVKRLLAIVDIKQSNRLSTITLSGSEEDMKHLVGGTYLYGAVSQLVP